LLGVGKQNSEHAERHLFRQNKRHCEWFAYDRDVSRAADTRALQERSCWCNQRSIAATCRHVGTAHAVSGKSWNLNVQISRSGESRNKAMILESPVRIYY